MMQKPDIAILWQHTTEELRCLRNKNLEDKRLDILLRLSRGHSIKAVAAQAKCQKKTVVQTIVEYNRTRLKEYDPLPQPTGKQTSYAFLYCTYGHGKGPLVLLMIGLGWNINQIADHLKISLDQVRDYAWQYMEKLPK